MLGVAYITHRNGTTETIEYVAHGATPIGWTFKLLDDVLVIVHPASVVKIEIQRYKIEVSRNGLVGV